MQKKLTSSAKIINKFRRANKNHMQKFHDKLMEKGGAYAKWHNYPKHHIFQWLFLLLVVGSAGWLLNNRINNPGLGTYGLFSSADQLKTPDSKGGRVGEDKNHILVKFITNLSDAKKKDLLARNNLTEGEEISGIKVKKLNLSANADPQEAVDRLIANEGDSIEFAEVDAILAPGLIPNDSWYASQWDKVKVDAPLAWDASTGLSTVIVGVADTGVDCTHEDLAANCVPGWNFYDKNSNTADVYGHGTAVAGIIGAVGNNAKGVAGTVWNSKIMPLRVSGTDGYASYSAIASAVTYAADHGAKVVNNSYQSGSSSTVKSAAHYLKDRGGLLTVSEGNYGTDTRYSNSPDIISVSATDANDVKYSWSSYGNDVDVAAPGCGYTTANGGSYRSFCGTSNSAPEAAGVLAIIFSVNTGLSPDQAQTILFNSAKDLGDPGWDIYYGWGRVDVAKALACASGEISCLGTTTPDTQAPTIPGNFTASAPDSTKVNLSWSASSDNVGVAGYKIIRGGVQINTASVASYVDTTVTAGNSYTYQVSAFDSAGNASALSNSASVTVPSASVKIIRPSVTGKTGTSAIVQWTTDVPSTGKVYYGTSSSDLNMLAQDSVLGTSHKVTLTGLALFTTYYYQIIATSQDGTASITSSTASFKTNKK